MPGMSFGGGPSWPGEPGPGSENQPPYGQQQGQQPHGQQYGQQQYGARSGDQHGHGYGQAYGQEYGQGYGPQPGAPSPVPYQEPYGQRSDLFPSAAETPDWTALADASAARKRRRKLLVTGAAALATAVVGTAIAVAVVSSGEGGAATAAPRDSTAPELPGGASGEPQPTFSSVAPPPPPDPMDYISDPAKDTAPLTAESLFPGKQLTIGEHAYTRGATAATADCAAAGQGGLAGVLARHGCDRMVRATFERDGVAVTVGIAVFDSPEAAQKVKKEAVGGVTTLAGAGVDPFCQARTVCLRRANAVGRYAYFTQAGFTSGKRVTTADRKVFAGSDDLGTFAFDRIHARGREQASAAAGG